MAFAASTAGLPPVPEEVERTRTNYIRAMVDTLVKEYPKDYHDDFDLRMEIYGVLETNFKQLERSLRNHNRREIKRTLEAEDWRNVWR